MLYILLIFNDQNCNQLNCMWFFDSIKKLLDYTNNILKYSDINKKVRYYKTAKSFFRVLKISNEDKLLYFK
jgi:hypothetical protein